MSITFGSVGDIIAVGQIAFALAKALTDSRGSAKEYQDLVKELKTFDQALLQVVALWQNYENSPELEALGRTTREAIKDWRDTLLAFRLKVDKKYGTRLSAGGSGAWVKDASNKLKWLREKEDVLELRRNLHSASDTLTLLILAAIGRSNRLTDSAQAVRVELVHGLLQESIKQAEEQMAQLKQMDEKLNSQAATSNMILTTIKSGVNYITQVHAIAIDMKGVLALLHNNLLSLQATPRGLGTNWQQEPVTLEDALGCMVPIPLELVNSWDLFDTILTKRFEKHPGHSKMLRREFAIEDITGKELSRTTEWSMCFRPGQKIDMSMVFQETGINTNHCPRCGTKSAASFEIRTQCASCKGWFQRVIEVDKEPVEEPEAFNPGIRQRTSRTPRKRDLVASPADFQRVRILRRIAFENTSAFGLFEHKDGRSQDRWAKIRKQAAERMVLRQKEEESKGRESHDTSDDEETIEDRVARIKTRVAELTSNTEKSSSFGSVNSIFPPVLDSTRLSSKIEGLTSPPSAESPPQGYPGIPSYIMADGRMGVSTSYDASEKPLASKDEEKEEILNETEGGSVTWGKIDEVGLENHRRLQDHRAKEATSTIDPIATAYRAGRKDAEAERFSSPQLGPTYHNRFRQQSPINQQPLASELKDSDTASLPTSEGEHINDLDVTLRKRNSRKGSQHKRHLPVGQLAGMGAAALLSNARDKQQVPPLSSEFDPEGLLDVLLDRLLGKEEQPHYIRRTRPPHNNVNRPEPRGRQVVGGAALGALGAEVLARAQSLHFDVHEDTVGLEDSDSDENYTFTRQGFQEFKNDSYQNPDELWTGTSPIIPRNSLADLSTPVDVQRIPRAFRWMAHQAEDIFFRSLEAETGHMMSPISEHGKSLATQLENFEKRISGNWREDDESHGHRSSSRSRYRDGP